MTESQQIHPNTDTDNSEMGIENESLENKLNGIESKLIGKPAARVKSKVSHPEQYQVCRWTLDEIELPNPCWQ